MTAELEYRAARLEVSTTVPVGTRYYWRLRACASSNCGDWSPVRYLDVGRVGGDYNGDGYSDLVVGAPRADSAENVLVYYGNTRALEGDADEWGSPDLLIANPLRVGADMFGAAVSSIGDIDADGYADLAVGAYNALMQGRVYVYLGSASGLSGEPALTLGNPQAQEGRFGFSLGGGDFNGDGCSDLAAGAYWQDTGAAREGNVFVYFGAAAGLGAVPTQIDSPHNRLNGEFGVDIADAGDLNGDGVSDLAVGAWLEEDPGGREGGRAYVFFGGTSGLATTPAVELANPLAQADGQFGVSLAAADINDDGLPDLVVGAPLQSDPEENEGGVYVFFGDGLGVSTSPDVIVDNPEDDPDGRFGFAVTAGDLDGDGDADLAAGAYVQDGRVAIQGRVFVLRGPDVPLAGHSVDTLGGSGTWFGQRVVVAGDLDGDGYLDLAVSAPREDGEGAVYVFPGGSMGPRTSLATSLRHPSHPSGNSFGLGL